MLPIINAKELGSGSLDRWVVYFPVDRSLKDASLYHSPFEFVRSTVKPVRDNNRRNTYRERWWVHGEARSAMLTALLRRNRFFVTQRVGKHRLFCWMEPPNLPSDATVAFAISDDYVFGVLHARVHELWARSQGTQLRERESGFRYTPTTCFETFPFPQPTDAQRNAIAAAAKDLDTLRNNWLNPPELVRTEVLEFPGTVGGPWDRYIDRATVKENAANPQALVGTVRYPRLVPKDEEAARELKRRTLTNLYNQRPAWLDQAHRKLDAAVFAAYGWEPALSDDELLAKLLELNLASV